MNSFISVMLIVLFNSYDQSNIDYILAKYIIEHIREFSDMSLKQFSEEVHVSVSSINHFLKRFSFQSFAGVKAYINRGLDFRYNQIKERYTYYDINIALNNIEFLSRQSIDKTKMILQIENVVDLLHEKKRIVVLGAVYPAALSLHFLEDMVLFGKCCRFIWKNTYEYDNTLNIEEDELLLIISYTGRLITMKNGINNQIKNTKGKSILISNDYIYENTVDSFLKIPVERGQDPEYQNAIVTELLSIIKFRYYEKYFLKENNE